MTIYLYPATLQRGAWERCVWKHKIEIQLSFQQEFVIKIYHCRRAEHRDAPKTFPIYAASLRWLNYILQSRKKSFMWRPKPTSSIFRNAKTQKTSKLLLSFATTQFSIFTHILCSLVALKNSFSSSVRHRLSLYCFSISLFYYSRTHRLCSSLTESISTIDKRDIDSYEFCRLGSDLSARQPPCMCTHDSCECCVWRSLSSHRSCKFRNVFLCLSSHGESIRGEIKCVNYPAPISKEDTNSPLDRSPQTLQGMSNSLSPLRHAWRARGEH